MAKNKAVFFDRDGTLIEYVLGGLIKPKQLKLFPGSAEVVKAFNKKGLFCIILTNQPIVEKGLISKAEAKRLNQLLVKQLAAQGAKIHAVYMCPHRYPSSCHCRKPRLGMIRLAVKRFGINLKQSYMVGDSMRDIETGRRAGMMTILVQTGEGGKGADAQFFSPTPDYTVPDMKAAAEVILRAVERG